MKTIITLAFLSFVTITTSAVGTQASTQPTLHEASVNNCFKYFRAHRQGAGVAMTWAANAHGIVKFEVERSYDGQYFDTVCDVACGGSDMHKFNDNDVFPGIIYYRVKAVKADGSAEYSAIETVRIVRRG